MTANIIASISLVVSVFSIYLTTLPDETTLTISTSGLEKSKRGNYYKLFVYNNNKAPCFEFSLNYDDNDFNNIVLMKDYDKSSIFNADFDGRIISFPPMRPIPITSSWLGHLDKTEIAYFHLYPSNKSKQRKISISCIDYKKEIFFK